MFDALSISATGMQAQQLAVNTIANNLANVNTPAFKKGTVSFTDMMMLDSTQLPSLDAVDDARAAGPLADIPQSGAGVGIASVAKMFDAGQLIKSGSASDVAIQGDGFLEVTLPDGSRAFTRGGSLKINADGMLATQSGYALKPGITIPANATNLAIDSNGRVTVSVPNRSSPAVLGQLEMVRFSNPGGLSAQGDNLYRSTDSSGEAIAGRPGQEGIGTLAAGFIEGSNVKMVDEMVNLMAAQRAYEANVKVVQASDEMLGMINNLRK